MRNSIAKNEKRIYLFLFVFSVFLFSSSLASALPDNIAEGVNFKSQKQNQSLSLVFSAINSTQCNVSYVALPDGTFTNVNLTTTSNGQVFNRTLAAGNFTQPGRTCFGLVCTNALDTGSLCVDVTPQGWTSTALFYFIFLLIIALTYSLGVKTENNWIMMFASTLVLFLGFFILNNGVDVIKDTNTTRALGFIIWGVAIISLYKSVEGQLAEGGWR